MYAVTVNFTIKPGRMPEFLPLMTQNAQTSLSDEPGCHVFDICHEGNQVFLYELYSDRAAFDAHLAAPHFKSFDAAVAEMVGDKSVTCYSGVIR